jgi:hypothetical protein
LKWTAHLPKTAAILALQSVQSCPVLQFGSRHFVENAIREAGKKPILLLIQRSGYRLFVVVEPK